MTTHDLLRAAEWCRARRKRIVEQYERGEAHAKAVVDARLFYRESAVDVFAGMLFCDAVKAYQAAEASGGQA